MPVPVTIKDVNPDANTFLDLTGTQKTILHQASTTYNSGFTRYQRYTKAKTTLLGMIRETVPQAYLPRTFDDRASNPRWLLRGLQTSVKPHDTHMRSLVFEKHRRLVGQKFTDWPAGEPEKWLMDWQDLMEECQMWYPRRDSNPRSLD